MSHTFNDNVARLHDIEALLYTAEGLLMRHSANELNSTRCQLRETIQALQLAREELVDRWRREES